MTGIPGQFVDGYFVEWTGATPGGIDDGSTDEGETGGGNDTENRFPTEFTWPSIKLNFNDGKTLLVEKDTIGYARPLPCGPIEHDDGKITEGCSSEEKNNGVEGSTSEFERHACCNVGWMAVDLDSAIAKYGEYNEEDLKLEFGKTGYINPSNYCGLDYGTGVYSIEHKLYKTEEDYQKLFVIQQEKDYKIDSWETVKGNFKVYNFEKVDDLQLLFANSFLFGTGKVFLEA